MAELTLLSSTPGGLTDAQLDRNMQNLNEELAGKQAAHANLAALSGLVGAADKLPYFTGAGALSVATLTAKARALLASADEAAMRTFLGLGTAAVAAITTSVVDTTAGRVLKVGDFGLGSQVGAPGAAGTNDLNTVVVSGVFATANTTLNSPPGAGSWGTLVVDSGNVAFKTQTYYEQGAPFRTWYRTFYNNTTWSAWQELWTSYNLAKQTSAADMTAGRVLLAGAHNLGVAPFAKNLIINGKMEIAQRGIAGSPGIGQEVYLLDRWFSFAAGAALAINQSSGPNSEFNSAIAATGAAGNTGIGFYQRVAAANSKPLAGKPAALSAWLYSTDAITATWYVFSADSANNYAGKTTRHTGTVALAAGWNYVTFPIASFNAIAAANGFQVGFAFPATTSGGIVRALTGVQLEVGEVATPFEHRPIGQELELCKRYTRILAAFGAMYTATAVNMYASYAGMRADPTLSIITGSTLSIFIAGFGGATLSSIGLSAVNSIATVFGTSSVSAAIGTPLASDDAILASAEL